MVRSMIIFISLLVILVCVICVFNARSIAKKRFESIEENKATRVIKITSFVITIIMLVFIYLYK